MRKRLKKYRRLVLMLLWLGVSLMVLSSCASPAGNQNSSLTEDKSVRALVNGEAITQEDLKAALSMVQDHSASEERLLKIFIENALIRQEAVRRDFDKSPEYKSMMHEWRLDMAPRLILARNLRSLLERKGRHEPFGEIVRDTQKLLDALTREEQEGFRDVVEKELEQAKEGDALVFYEGNMKEYAGLIQIPHDKAMEVILARAGWGEVSLADVLAKERSVKAHLGQTIQEVVKMWKMIIEHLDSRENTYRTVEKQGLYQTPAVLEEEVLAGKRLLKVLFMDSYYGEKISGKDILERTISEIGQWSRQMGLESEMIILPGVSRREADEVFRQWGDDPDSIAKLGGRDVDIEKMSLDLAWNESSSDIRKLMLSQPWDEPLPPVWDKQGYVMFKITAMRGTDRNVKKLSDLAVDFLQREAYADLIRGLMEKSDIKVN